MANTVVSSIRSKASQILGSFQRWAVLSPSSSSDARSKILKDLKKLERTLTRIQAVLYDAEDREIREKAINLWLKELKEVAYEAEDVLDEYHYEELQAQVEGRASRKRKRAEVDDEEEVSGSPSTIVVSIPDGMGDRIREIRERFDEISEDRERLRLREEDEERRVLGAVYPAPTSHMVEEWSIYGREQDKQKVIDLLFSEGMGNVISVIPIVGKGGLGKTTIAQLVYNDSKVKEYFDLTGWVCVSDDFDVTKLTKDIIESFTQQSCDRRTQLSILQNTLEANVKGKKVLLVLDDVWNEQRSLWESLKRPLVLGAGTVRIIVTCRNVSVAEIMQTVHPYHPGYLSEDESWLLFKHYAFDGRDSEEQSQLTDVGEQIVEKCSGLPLAIKTIGSLLRETTDEDSWKDVLQSDLWEVDRNNETLAALRISYIRMPAYLKPCFVYCSMFPKDYVFEKDVLVRLWMAQGYIPLRDRRRMEEIGNEYFIDLQRRSFFDSGRPFYIETKRLILDSDEIFKMHDLIHDLAKSIAGNECCTIMGRKLPSFLSMVRHLYMENKKELVKSLCSHNLGAPRTLLLEGWDQRNKRIMVPEHYARTLVSGRTKLVDRTAKFHRIFHRATKFPPPLRTQFPPPLLGTRCLRTLQIDWESEEELPDSIDNLKHLRYLHIRSHCIKRLPKSVCLLYHLQTLILDGSLLEELPDGLGNLIELRYFELHSYVIKRLPELVCRLHNLRTLKLFCPHLVELPYGLSRLTNLQYFELRSNVVKTLPGSICQLPNLQILDIGLCKNLVELPSGIASLANLRFLNTARTGIQCLPVGIEKLTIPWILHGQEIVRGRIGLLKGLHIQGTILISGLRNLVNIEDARDANLKCKHKIERLSLAWNGQHDHLLLCLRDALHIEASPEENKGVPIDEQKEEAMLEYLQPHTNLKNLHIVGYGGSQFPNWVGNPFSCASLKEVSINGCENIRSLPLYIHNSLGKLDAPMPQSVLERVHILSCRQLTSMVGLHTLRWLQYLRIYDCPQLTLLSGMKNLTSLRQLIIKNCPNLKIMAEDQLSSMHCSASLVDCPGLVNWCRIQRFDFIKVVSGNKMTIISNTWERIKDEFDRSISMEHRDPMGYSSSRSTNGPVLEELKIWSCELPVWCLKWDRPSWFESLRRLVIKDCCAMPFLPDVLLAYTLKSLVVDSCDLGSLKLTPKNRDALEELQIVNCPKFVRLQGLKHLIFLKLLRIKQCPQLQLSQDDWLLPSTHPHVEIEGVLETKFYPPHSENKETIDDGTQEKQVMKRWVGEQQSQL
ncbi:putative disease resistance RPP13-like protein 1 isoform X2 [Elaeis guineensis]|uniref:putative disease resistance RPP13-like protein 1 isoform X2 n=1 Tax=Elaeis guineensis var. tenera TaxID=51953 RepID=UPI00094FAC29